MGTLIVGAEGTINPGVGFQTQGSLTTEKCGWMTNPPADALNRTMSGTYASAKFRRRMENSEPRLSHLLGGFVAFLSAPGVHTMYQRTCARFGIGLLWFVATPALIAQDIEPGGWSAYTDQWLTGVITLSPEYGYEESSMGLEPPRWDGGRTTLTIADLNGDGNPDIVSVGDHGSPYINTDLHGVSVWFGDGTGRWTSYQTGTFGYGGIAIGDVNNDGLLDAGWGIHHDYSSTDLGDQLLEVALGDGTGRNWTPWDDGLANEGQSWGMFGTVFGDWNVDGWLDIASVSFGCCDGYHIYLNNTDGTWTRTQGALGGNSRMDLVTGDINNDGFPDLAMSHDAGTAWLGQGDGTFINIDATLPNNGNRIPGGVALGDITGDGQDELAYANSDGGVDLLHWDVDTMQWIDVSSNLPDAGGASAVRLADMDNNGRLDVVGFGDGRAVVFHQRARTQVFDLAATFTVRNPGSYEGLAVGDINHDGRPDFVIVSEQGGVFNSRNEMQVFKAVHPLQVAAVRITEPVAGRVWRHGMATTIRWQAGVPSHRGARNAVADLSISLDGRDGPWTEIAKNLPNSGHHQVTASHGGTPRTNAWLRIVIRPEFGDPIERVHGPIEIRE